MLDLNKPADAGCRMSDVGFLQVGCRIFTSRMLIVGFLKSDVGWHLSASVQNGLQTALNETTTFGILGLLWNMLALGAIASCLISYLVIQ